MTWSPRKGARHDPPAGARDHVVRALAAGRRVGGESCRSVTAPSAAALRAGLVSAIPRTLRGKYQPGGLACAVPAGLADWGQMMGEYILLDGQPYKVGTCEDLYYCRYADLVEWINAGRAAKMPANDEPADYLTGAYRFRFPFPDEDGPERARLAAYGAQYDRGVLMPYPIELLTADITHYNAFAAVMPCERNDHTTAHRVRATFATPCPFDAAAEKPASTIQIFAASDSPGFSRYEDRGPWVEVVEQRPLDGVLWPVFRCPFCGGRWRVEYAEAVTIAVYARAASTALDLSEILNRMLAGYDGQTAGGA